MKVTYEQIEEIANNLRTYSKNMSDILTDITTEMNKVGQDGVWSGEAAESVKAEFSSLNAKFSTFYDTVNDCATHLDVVVNNYRSVDTAINSGR